MIPLTELFLPLSPAPGLKSDLQDGVEGTEEVESEREVASIAGGGDLPELIFGKTQIGAAAQETEEPVRVVPAPRRRRGESSTHQGNYARSMLTEIGKRWRERYS